MLCTLLLQSSLVPINLITWNCKHLANAALQTKIEQVCRMSGYEPVRICTPEQLLEEQDDA
jgi:hypothetical protein